MFQAHDNAGAGFASVIFVQAHPHSHTAREPRVLIGYN
jgi:hypothetical protein